MTVDSSVLVAVLAGRVSEPARLAVSGAFVVLCGLAATGASIGLNLRYVRTRWPEEDLIWIYGTIAVVVGIRDRLDTLVNIPKELVTKVVFDRGGYSPQLFQEIVAAGFDFLTYRKGRYPRIPKRCRTCRRNDPERSGRPNRR